MVLVAYEKATHKIVTVYVGTDLDKIVAIPDLWLKVYCAINQLDLNLYGVAQLDTWNTDSPIIQGRDRYNELTGQIETDPDWVPNSD